jgi:hypothetical protein
MSLINKVNTLKSTSRYFVSTEEGSFCGQFRNLRFKVRGSEIKIWGTAVFTRNCDSLWFSTSFEDDIYLTDFDGSISHDYLDGIKSKCLNRGFMPSDTLLSQVFRPLEEKLPALHRSVIEQAFPKSLKLAVA